MGGSSLTDEGPAASGPGTQALGLSNTPSPQFRRPRRLPFAVTPARA